MGISIVIVSINNHSCWFFYYDVIESYFIY